MTYTYTDPEIGTCLISIITELKEGSPPFGLALHEEMTMIAPWKIFNAWIVECQDKTKESYNMVLSKGGES